MHDSNDDPFDDQDRRHRRRRRTAAALLDDAEALLLTTSARALRLEDVAARADVAARTAYNHFGSREGLLLALAERALDAVEPRFLAALSAPGPSRERVRHALLAYADAVVSRPEKANVLAAALGDPTDCPAPDVAARVARRHLGYVELLRRTLGEPGGAADPDRLALFLLAALQGALALVQSPPPLRRSPDEARAVLAAGLDALLGDPEGPPNAAPGDPEPRPD